MYMFRYETLLGGETVRTLPPPPRRIVLGCPVLGCLVTFGDAEIDLKLRSVWKLTYSRAHFWFRLSFADGPLLPQIPESSILVNPQISQGFEGRSLGKAVCFIIDLLVYGLLS